MKSCFTWNIYGSILLLICLQHVAIAQVNKDPMGKDKFKQLYEEFPTANTYRTGSGAPGHEYWQNRANYVIKVQLDDQKQTIQGEETVTYINNSPDVLTYLWLQLDQNIYDKNSETYAIKTNKLGDKTTASDILKLSPEFDGGYRIESVTTADNKALPYTIVKTMMRIDMPAALAPGKTYSFKIKYHYNINDRGKVGGRSGYEYFKDEDNYLYTIAQFFPRMAVYHDAIGWQHKQFLGAGEFTLAFGNYEVHITVPQDHLVAATGVLQNPSAVLNSTQQSRFAQAKQSFDHPVVIANQEEAEAREKKRNYTPRTWIFKAENVRDFAFASSRKFIWDAMAVKMSNGFTTLAMSMYPKEGNPLWGQYSTKAVAHTLRTYSHFTIDYPYPCAWSINAANIGMEYPMICFNFGRCEPDGTYSEGTKYGVLGVIFHEVGHNFFPMIINSDERQWTWMDEGLNTFTQYLTEQQWERDFPSGRGPAYKIADYMKGDPKFLEPIMTNSESISQFGNNAYGKPATALNILRETILGRELFDFAFKTYAQRWAFKHPTPADFFRTMEDASGVDLDWFWRGWFYTTDFVDQSIASVKWMQVGPKDPDALAALKAREKEQKPLNISEIRYRDQKEKTYQERDSTLIDFYSNYDPDQATAEDRKNYEKAKAQFSEDEKNVLNGSWNVYELTLQNKGELVMPVILQFEFNDGSSEIRRIPAEIWKLNSKEVTKVFAFQKEVKQISLDPFLEIADTDLSNNYYPEKKIPTRFDLFKAKNPGNNAPQQENPMQKHNRLNKSEGTSN